MPILRGLFGAKGFTFPEPDAPVWRALGGTRLTKAGTAVGPASASTISAVYAATTLNAQAVAMLPYQFQGKGDRNHVEIFPAQVEALWRRPNPDPAGTRVSFIEQIVLSFMWWGNFYAFPMYSRSGKLLSLYPLDPGRLEEVQRFDDGAIGYKFRDQPMGVNRPGDPPQIVHIPWIVKPGKILGASPVEEHAELMGMSLSAQEHAAGFLGTGVHMSGVIEADNVKDGAAAKELWETFSFMNAGPANAGRVGFLSAAKFNQLTIPPNELQFLEQMQYTDRRIASIYRVPPHMVGDMEKSTTWGPGLEEQVKGYATFTLIPIAKHIEHGFEAAFGLEDSGVEMRFKVNGLLRGSPKDRAEFYNQLGNAGAMNPDEMRELEDMAPIPGGSGAIYRTPLNVADQATRDAAIEQSRAETVGALIRAGYDPAEVAARLGFDGLTHLGPLPVTVQADVPPAVQPEVVA